MCYHKYSIRSNCICTILYFIQINIGKSEIYEYLKKLLKKSDNNSRIKLNKITAYIDILCDKGINIGEPYIKHIENDIWELRPLRDRILFAYWNNNKFILLNIFMKESQKTPKREIDKAKRLLKDFLDRSGRNE